MRQAAALARPVSGRLARLLGDDGFVLRLVFYAMLAGAGSVLVQDYLALNQEEGAGEARRGGAPVLPAVERPESDPANPAFRPHERITTPQDVLSAPLDIALVAGGVLQLTGTIYPGAAMAFATEVALRGDYVETVLLNSPGGSVEDALAIGAQVHAMGFATAVEDGALCASSCPLILAAGKTRSIAPGGSVGIHQIYVAPSDSAGLGPAQAMSDAQSITARITRHLDMVGIDPALWLHALETPPDRLYYLTPEELTAFGFS